MYFIGVDIGTSGTKAVCMDEAGNIKNSWFVSYGFEHTARGVRELDPRQSGRLSSYVFRRYAGDVRWSP